jgi:hypothetical protein
VLPLYAPVYAPVYTPVYALVSEAAVYALVSEAAPSEEQEQVIKKQRLAEALSIDSTRFYRIDSMCFYSIERHSKTKRYIRVTDMKSSSVKFITFQRL